MERLPYKECETCRDWNGNINKCHLCTEKCPQEELACEIAKGRMYATNEMKKCRTCLQECLYNQNKDYNKELSVKCWKKAFIESEE